MDPFPESWEFPGNLETNSPDFERIDDGETVLEAGAKIFASHGPGNAVSAGPLHVVFFQQFWAVVESSRTKKVASQNRALKTAISGDYDRYDQLIHERIPFCDGMETYVLVRKGKIYKTFRLRYIHKPRGKFVRRRQNARKSSCIYSKCGEITRWAQARNISKRIQNPAVLITKDFISTMEILSSWLDSEKGILNKCT